MSKKKKLESNAFNYIEIRFGINFYRDINKILILKNNVAQLILKNKNWL